MKFSVFLLSQGLAEGAEPHRTFAHAIEEAQLAEELGFDCVWLAEHHFTNYGFCSSPLQLGIKIAASTQRIRVGTGVLVLPLYNPIRLAEDVAMADVLMDGRLELGIGRGYQKEEFDKMGIPLSESRTRFEESVDILVKAWTEKDFTYEGEHYRIEHPLTIWPEPYQKPHPPITVAASSENSLRWAAENGYAAFNSGYFVPDSLVGEAREMYVRGLEAAGKPTDAPEFKSLRFMNLTEDGSIDPEAVASSRWTSRVSASFMSGAGSVVEGRVGEVGPSPKEPSDEEWIERLVFGSPERVLEKVRRFEEVGITELCCWFGYGTLGPEKIRRSMELFAEGVIRPLREGSATVASGARA